MTVIAYRSGTMAADSGTWCGDVIVGTTSKIKRLSDGGLYAGYGGVVFIQGYLDRLNGQDIEQAAEKDEDFGGLHIDPSGQVWVVDKTFREYRLDAEFYAMGAHNDFLYGAMAAGASAEEAVRLALRYCAFARGEVQVMRLSG